MRYLKQIIFLLFICTKGFGQQLAYNEFIDQVKKNHPLSKQATIVVDKANADAMVARSNFDPTIGFQSDMKTFDGKNYFNYQNTALKIPTWAGIDISTGIESNKGQFLNSEVSKGQSSYLGISVPVIKNLVIDRRRAAVLQAKNLILASEQEKQSIVNNLLLDASLQYWKWAAQYQLLKLYNQYVVTSNNRFNITKIAFNNGERAALDTLEALTQLQQLKILENDAQLLFTNAGIELSYFLWDNQDSALQLSPTMIPDTLDSKKISMETAIGDLISLSILQNPEVRAYEYKINNLLIEKKLKFQSLLPMLNVKSNILNQNYNVFKDAGAQFYQNNYKFGVDFKMPLFLREGRGEYRKAKLKIEETNLAFAAKKIEVQNKVKTYSNENFYLKNQLETLFVINNNTNALLKGELIKFYNGDSNLFVVNARENKVIETAEKLISLQFKIVKSYFGLKWASGTINQ
jgi:outer membrane protein TolC